LLLLAFAPWLASNFALGDRRKKRCLEICAVIALERKQPSAITGFFSALIGTHPILALLLRFV
jgi:hypothetical protein